MRGYGGKIVHVNLPKGKVFEEETEKDLCRSYLGGKGFGGKILYTKTRRGIDPLSPDNLLIFSVGPMNASLVPGANRLGAFFKSPLTGIFGESYCGGHIGVQLKLSGIDALAVWGRSPELVYLLVDDGKVEIKEAEHLRGKDSFETQDILVKDLGRGFHTAAIGPAGENLVRFACVDHGKGRQLGRCGAGAVMGSKRLKALAIRGSRNVEVADSEAVEEVRRKVLNEFKEKLKGLSNYGTANIAVLTDSLGVLPTRNWNDGTFEKLEDTSAETLKARFYKRRRSCYGCPVACLHISEVTEGPYAGARVEGPEYETLYAFSPLCEINSPEALVKINELCDRLGMDTMTAGNVVAFAMECYERGILDEGDAQGLKLKFGNHEAVIELLPKIAYRKGLGIILAEGVRRASQLIGRDSGKLAVHVKGLEPAGYDPRGLKGVALAYAVSCRGACHLRHMAYRPNLMGKHPFNPEKDVDRLSYENHAAMVKELEDFYAVVDSMICCHFLCLPTIGPILWDELVKSFNGVTGAGMTLEAMVEAASRINDTVRWYNLREGVPSDFQYPEKWFNKLGKGNSAGHTVRRAKLKQMIAEYYRLRGWSRRGKPKTRKRMVA